MLNQLASGDIGISSQLIPIKSVITASKLSVISLFYTLRCCSNQAQYLQAGLDLALMMLNAPFVSIRAVRS